MGYLVGPQDRKAIIREGEKEPEITARAFLALNLKVLEYKCDLVHMSYYNKIP